MGRIWKQFWISILKLNSSRTNLFWIEQTKINCWVLCHARIEKGFIDWERTNRFIINFCRTTINSNSFDCIYLYHEWIKVEIYVLNYFSQDKNVEKGRIEFNVVVKYFRETTVFLKEISCRLYLPELINYCINYELSSKNHNFNDDHKKYISFQHLCFISI